MTVWYPAIVPKQSANRLGPEYSRDVEVGRLLYWQPGTYSAKTTQRIRWALGILVLEHEASFGFELSLEATHSDKIDSATGIR